MRKEDDEETDYSLCDDARLILLSVRAVTGQGRPII